MNELVFIGYLSLGVSCDISSLRTLSIWQNLLSTRNELNLPHMRKVPANTHAFHVVMPREHITTCEFPSRTPLPPKIPKTEKHMYPLSQINQ